MPSINASDPVDFFPPEVTLKIFEFLNFDDLLLASLASTEWYDFIGDSQECMKKIKIKMKCSTNRHGMPKVVSMLINSTRKYENLEISRCEQCINDVEALFTTRKKQWKRVKIVRTTFQCGTQALDFLESIQHSVEELVMLGVHITDTFTNGQPRNFVFPKLKVLHTKHIQTLLFHEVFDNITTLTDFALWSHDQSVASLNSVEKLLKVNGKLKYLEISNNVFNQIFYPDNFKNYKFKLKKLSVNGHYRLTEFHEQIQRNFMSLLTQQSRTLETLHLGDWMGVEVLKVAYQMPNLKDLAIKGTANIEESIEWERVILPKSNSIFKLSIQQHPNNLFMLKVLTDAVPKLTCFSNSFMEKKFMRHLSKTHQNLSCLSIGTLSVDNVSQKDLFKAVRNLSVKSFDRLLKIRVVLKDEKERTHFEKMLRSLL